ncbi:hypothetical protein GCM10027591_03840 [Zhihengliuella somnathii]
MSLDIGTLVGFIDLNSDKFDSKLSGIDGKVSAFGGKFGKVVAAGTVAAGAAVAGFATKGVGDFANFEKGMNEVFTLLPGISEDAMGSMMDDTREFVREMGVAHDEAVPALYSALSAGVPKDNVFEFLETANQAALGGVTDLNTAVDGISSVTNAYGDQISGAAEASDLMFTAVKNGKTTYDELAGSLYNVVPTAASLGVEFGDVTAAMASMTAQGVPTSVATTQLRQMMVELSKDGGKTADTFEKIAGKSFKDFIAEGGNTQEALALLQEHAEDTGVGVNDLFGSVEAGNAALALSGDNAQDFATNIGEMAKSAGATEGAFEQMDQGLARSWDRLKINVADAAMGFGNTLAPAVQNVADWAGDKLPGALDRLGGFLESTAQFMTTTLPAAFTTVMGFFERNKAAIQITASVIGVVLLPALVRMAAVATITAAKKVAAWVVMQAGAIKTAAVYVAQSAVIVARWVLMGAQAMIQAARMAAAWLIAMGPVGIVIAIIIGLVALIIANWESIKTWTINTWNSIVEWIVNAWNSITTWVSTAVENVKNFVRDGFNKVKSTVTSIWDSIVAWVKGIPNKILNALIQLAVLYLKMREWVNSVKQAAIDKFNEVVAWVKGVPDRIVSALGNVGSLLADAGRNIINGFLDGLKSAYEGVKDFIGGIGSWIANNKGPKQYDLGLLVPAGGWIMDGLQDGIESEMPALKRTLGGVSGLIEAGITPTVEANVRGNLSSRNAMVELSAYDRQLLMDARDRPVSVKVDSREIARASVVGTQKRYDRR